MSWRDIDLLIGVLTLTMVAGLLYIWSISR